MSNDPSEKWVPAGYVLRGGPRDGEVKYTGLRNAFVATEWSDDPRDIWRPSLQPDGQYPDLERFDYQELDVPRAAGALDHGVNRWAEITVLDDAE